METLNNDGGMVRTSFMSSWNFRSFSFFRGGFLSGVFEVFAVPILDKLRVEACVCKGFFDA